MAADPDVMLAQMREDRNLLQCVPSMGQAWRLVWMEGKRRMTSTNGAAPLRTQLACKRVNLTKLYEEGSELQVHMMIQWANLAWILEQIETAEKPAKVTKLKKVKE